MTKEQLIELRQIEKRLDDCFAELIVLRKQTQDLGIGVGELDYFLLKGIDNDKSRKT